MSKFTKLAVIHSNTADGTLSETVFDHINTTINRIEGCTTIDDIRARYDLFFGDVTKDLFDSSKVEDIEIIPNVCDTFKYSQTKHRVATDDGVMFAYNPTTGNKVGRKCAENGTWYKCDKDGNYKFKKIVFQKLFYVIADPAFNTRARYDAAQERAAKLKADFSEHLACRPVKNSGSTEVTIN